MREALGAALDTAPGIDVLDTTGNGMEAIVLTRSLRPDVVVTGLELEGIPGYEMIRRLRRENLDTHPHVVVFAINDSDEAASDALATGANGVLDKDASQADLVLAIRLAAQGQTMLSPRVAQRLVRWFRERRAPAAAALHPVISSLTLREREVMGLAAHGLSDDEIASRLTIGQATVRSHVYRVRCKLGARDRAQLVSLAYQSGLVHPA